MERKTIQSIFRQFGITPPPEEAERAYEFINSTTYLKKGVVAVPPQGSGVFHRLPEELSLDEGELANRMSDIFRKKDTQVPENVYVLTEEKTEEAPQGVAKFEFPNFIENVVPYVNERGTGNYWASDAEETTVTFHKSGVIYWRKAREQESET